MLIYIHVIILFAKPKHPIHTRPLICLTIVTPLKKHKRCLMNTVTTWKIVECLESASGCRLGGFLVVCPRVRITDASHSFMYFVHASSHTNRFFTAKLLSFISSMSAWNMVQSSETETTFHYCLEGKK